MKTLTAFTALNLALFAVTANASSNLRCDSLFTKSLKLFVNLAESSATKGTATLGIGSNVDSARFLKGGYTVFYGQPNTRLAGKNVITITASGLLGERNTTAQVTIYSDVSSGFSALNPGPVGDVGYEYASAEIGKLNQQGQLEVFEKVRLSCISLN